MQPWVLSRSTSTTINFGHCCPKQSDNEFADAEVGNQIRTLVRRSGSLMCVFAPPSSAPLHRWVRLCGRLGGSGADHSTPPSTSCPLLQTIRPGTALMREHKHVVCTGHAGALSSAMLLYTCASLTIPIHPLSSSNESTHCFSDVFGLWTSSPTSHAAPMVAGFQTCLQRSTSNAAPLCMATPRDEKERILCSRSPFFFVSDI